MEKINLFEEGNTGNLMKLECSLEKGMQRNKIFFFFCVTEVRTNQSTLMN